MTDYQKSFLEAMAFTHVLEPYRTRYTPDKTSLHRGYFISYEPRPAFQLVVANYKIAKPFTIQFNSKKPYLRIGLMEKGLSQYSMPKKQLKTFTPSPYMIYEQNAQGHQYFSLDSHYIGVELIVDIDTFLRDYKDAFPEIESLFSLKSNFIYYYLPLEVIDILKRLKHFTLNNQLTNLYLEGQILSSLGLLIQELSSPDDNLYVNHFNYSAMVQSKRRMIHLSEQEIQSIKKIYALINADIINPPSVDVLCDRYYIGRQKLLTGFKRLYGQTMGKFILDRKLSLAVKWLTTTDFSIQEIAFNLGYSHTSNFAKAFKKKYKKTPLQYRKQHH